MRAQSAALGMAAAAVVSSAAAALPCAPALPNKTTTSEFSCTADAGIAGSPPRAREDDKDAASSDDDTQAAGQIAVLADTPGVTDTESFDGDGIKVTNLQATMTSNRFVAGHLPLAPARRLVDDLIMFSPDYLSIKLLPRVPKRNPVGVGLVTVPKPAAKDAEKTAPNQGLPPTRP